MPTIKARGNGRWESLLMGVLAGSPSTAGTVYAGLVDPRSEIREFLTSRRALITPGDAGLPDYGGPRRVPGLRREEVAVLAGVSVPYYTRMERGDMRGASDSVLEALSRALRLDEAETAHLHDLARAAQPQAPSRTRRPRTPKIRPNLQWILDSMTGGAAFLRNGRLDVLGANHLGRALYSEMYTDPTRPVNTARFVFLDPRAEDFYLDWNDAAVGCAAVLRTEAGRDPHDRDLSALVGELSTRSEAFRTYWASHNVRFLVTGTKRFHHPVVGDLELSFDRLDLAGSPGLSIYSYTAEPGSRSEEALNLLASWAATLEQEQAAADDRA